MSFKFGLRENPLNKTGVKNYIASPQRDASKSIDDIIDMMIGKGSTVTRAEAFSVIEEFNWAIEQILLNGGSINTPMFNMAPSVTGTFETEDEKFNKNKHQVNLNINAGTRLSKIIPLIPVEKVGVDKLAPYIKTFIDIVSEMENSTLTPGGIGQIAGDYLKVDAADAKQGVFFIDKASVETKVASNARNMPGELIFMIPGTLKKGNYRLEVRAILPNTKKLRKGTLVEELTVK
jgi:hypothetical protein